jgi:hypothetical protein
VTRDDDDDNDDDDDDDGDDDDDDDTNNNNNNNNNRIYRYFPDECVSLGSCREFRTKKGNHLPAEHIRITECSSGSYGAPRVDKGTMK